MFTDIMDAGSPVAVEQEGKQFSDKIVVYLTFLHILVAFGTSMETFLLTALAYLAPRCFLILLASRAFPV